MKEELEILVRNAEEKLNSIYYGIEGVKPIKPHIVILFANQGILLEKLIADLKLLIKLIADLKLLITKQEQQ